MQVNSNLVIYFTFKYLKYEVHSYSNWSEEQYVLKTVTIHVYSKWQLCSQLIAEWIHQWLEQLIPRIPSKFKAIKYIIILFPEVLRGVSPSKSVFVLFLFFLFLFFWGGGGVGFVFLWHCLWIPGHQRRNFTLALKV